MKTNARLRAFAVQIGHAVLGLTPLMLLLGALLLVTRANAADESAALRDVRAATEKLQALIHEHREQYAKQRAAFDAVVDDTLSPVFDVPALAQHALGPAWRNASADQRTRFQAAFKTTLIRAYSTALLAFSDSVRVQWLPPGIDGTTTRVRANLVRASGPPIELDFELHQAEGGWKIFDMKVDAISLITGFKSQYLAEVRRDGLDALIHRLETGQPAHG